MFNFSLVIFGPLCIFCVIAFFLSRALYCIIWDCFKSSRRALHALFADCSSRNIFMNE